MNCLLLHPFLLVNSSVNNGEQSVLTYFSVERVKRGPCNRVQLLRFFSCIRCSVNCSYQFLWPPFSAYTPASLIYMHIYVPKYFTILVHNLF
jgi:hypothetical protein